MSKGKDSIDTFCLLHLCLPLTIAVRTSVEAPFEYEIRIRWRTTHISVYVCLNWPLYGNGPDAARWKRIDSIRCVSRIEVTPVGRFASGCFRSKGFNIKPRPPSPDSQPRSPIIFEWDGIAEGSVRRICKEYFIDLLYILFFHKSD